MLTRFVGRVPQKHVPPPLVSLDLNSDIVAVLVGPSHVEHDPHSESLRCVEPRIQLTEVIADTVATRNNVEHVEACSEFPHIIWIGSEPCAAQVERVGEQGYP